MARDLVAGIDSSTQSCTVMLRSLADGTPVAEARAEHPATFPPRSEQDPRCWWQALLACLSDLDGRLDRIAAVAVGGQGHGLVMLDEADEPVRPAKLWNDTEAAPDAERLCGQLPAAEWAARTGSVPGPALTISKLAWTERVHPGLVARARRIMLPCDYLTYRLSGTFATERGGASGTGYFNPFLDCWEPRLASLAVPGIDWSAVLPRIVASDAPVGHAGPAPAGLRGAVVAPGTGDNMTAALGIAVSPGDTVISLGTSGTIYGVSETGIKDRSGSINGYAHAGHAFMPMVTTLNAAKVTDTFRRLLGVGFEEFDALALSAPSGSDGLVLVPYLDGERTPNRPDGTGLLNGLRTGADRGTFARAAVEGVLCGLLEGGDLLRQHGLSQDGRLILTGGASRSRAFRQILADLTGRSVWACPLTEAAAAGAAVLAAAALTGTRLSDAAAAWAPTLEIVAEPGGADPAPVRAAYREAAALA